MSKKSEMKTIEVVVRIICGRYETNRNEILDYLLQDSIIVSMIYRPIAHEQEEMVQFSVLSIVFFFIPIKVRRD